MGTILGIKTEEFIKLYESGMSAAEIADIYNCQVGSITTRLKKAGIPYKTDWSKRRRKARSHYPNNHQFNELYFDNIDTEDKAYFLGWMFSDGSVTRTYVYLKITDPNILDDFNRCLEGDFKITTVAPPEEHPTWKHTYKLQIYSTYFSSSLQKLGCVPNKARVIRFPNIPKSLYKHFIRGFFDGDGCLILNYTIGHCVVDFACASYNFLLDLQSIILSQVGITSAVIKKEKKYDVWHLRYCGKKILTLLDWLYDDAHFYLKRKHYKYQLLSPLKMGRTAGKSDGIISSRADL